MRLVIVRLGGEFDGDKEAMLQHLEEVHGLDRRKLEKEDHDLDGLLKVHELTIQAEEARERAAPLN